MNGRGLAPQAPHDRILAMALQRGLVGATALIAMWIVDAVLRSARPAGTHDVVMNVTPPLFHWPLGDEIARSIRVIGVGAPRVAVQRCPAAPRNGEGEP